MKTKLFFIVFLLLTLGVLLPYVYSSPTGRDYREPPRALPEGAKMRIGRGQVNDFVFSQDSHRLAVACSIIGIWIYDVQTGDELALLTGHTDSVTAVAFSPNGTILASGSYDQTVRLWDAHTYEHLGTLIGHVGNVRALAFSPDGKILASGASSPRTNQNVNQHVEKNEVREEVDSFIRVWDVATGRNKMTLVGHIGWTNDLAFSPDGSTLASASTDGSVRLWDAATGRHKLTLIGHTNQVVSVAFSADSTRLISCGDDETARLWDVDTGEQKLVIEGCRYGAVAFSPDGVTLACGQGIDNATIRLWDAHTGKGKQKLVLDAQRGTIFSVVFSPDGSKIVSGGNQQDPTVKWWDPNDPEYQAPLEDDSGQIYAVEEPRPKKNGTRSVRIPALLFSPNGATLAEHIDNEIRLWDAHAKKQRTRIAYPDFSRERFASSFAAFSSDGKTLACGDGTTKIWLFDAKISTYRATLNGHTDAVYNVAFSPDGTMLASASKDQTVRVWNVHTGEHHTTLNEQAVAVYLLPFSAQAVAVYPLAFSADGSMLASGSLDGTLRLWDVQTGKNRGIFTGHAGPVRAVGFAADRKTLISLGGNGSGRSGILLSDTLSGNQQVILNSWGRIPIAFSRDGATFVSGERWEIQLWHANTGQHKGVLTGHLDNTVRLAFSPDGTMLASAGKTIQLWDVNTRKNRSTFLDYRDKSYYNLGGSSALAFSSDSQFLAATVRGAIKLWDVTLHQHSATLLGHGLSVTSVAFAPHNGMLASTSYDRTIVLWEPVQVVDPNTIAKITTSPEASLVIGERLAFDIEISGAEKVAGYQLTMAFDETVLRYVSSTKGSYLRDNAFFARPIVEKNQVTLASTALTKMGNGAGRLATLTFEIVDVKSSTLRLSSLILSDPAGRRVRADVGRAQVEIK